MFEKMIISHIGEVTQDMRTVGDKIRYRIYYGDRPESLSGEIDIVDKADENLSKITVFDDGVYDERSRTITWTVPAVRFKSRRFVEFEAVATHNGLITNEATTEGGGVRPVTSNIVKTTVGDSPPLGWIPFFEDTKDGEAPRAYMKDETTTGITVRFDIPGLFIYKQEVDGVAYQHITIPSRAGMTEVGKPELPIVGEIIEVPFDVDFSPEVVKAETIRLSGYNVYPAQEPRIDQNIRGGLLRPPLGTFYPSLQRIPSAPSFELDAPTYQADTDYPSTPFSISNEDIAVIRGHRVLFLKVNPVLYNPAARTLTVYKTIEVRIRFGHPAQVKGVDTRLRSRDFEELLAAAVLNYKPQERFMSEGGGGEEEQPGCEYLIITHDAFYNESDSANPVLRFADWKRCKGYRTKVVKVGSIPGGNTPNAIQTYLQNAWNTWNPPPTYVLLIGESDLVHAVPGVHHDWEHHPLFPQPQIQTDLRYVTVDGTDDIPDICIGRLSADTLQQVTDMIDKIITYEQTPPVTPANAGFYSNVSLVGLFTERDEDPAVITGQEDRPWIANMETIRGFLQNQGYTVERIYATDTGFPQPITAQAPLRYNDGTQLPNDLLHPQYGWNGGTNQISNAINAGRFLLTYRGHGSWGGWALPAFANNQAGALAQNDLTPLVISVTCEAGWFDNESDDDTHGGRLVGDDCFTEVMLRRPHSGAIGLLGMTRVSTTGWNDFLIFGAYKAIWPTFNPDPPWIMHPAVPVGQQVSLRKLGQIANFSKIYMVRAYMPSDTRVAELEMHHLFGDPETTLWTSAPGDLGVDYPKGIGAVGLQEFVVKVTNQTSGQAVANATIVLTRGHDIIQMQQTRTDGLAPFGLTDVGDGDGDGDLDLTVTALDYRPYLGTLTVTAKGAELNRLDPDDGPENQIIHVGGRNFAANENVEIYFGQGGPTMTTADANGDFGQALPTVDLTVPANYPHGLVNVYACGMTSHRKAVRIFQVRDKNPVDLWTYNQRNSSTWTLHPGNNPTWNSPDIQLYDSSNNPADSNNLMMGQKYTVKVNVRNKTAFAAPGANIVFKWQNFGAGGPWQALPPTVAATIAADPPGVTVVQTDFEPPAAGHLCLQVNIEHLDDIDTTNNTGQENLHVGYSGSPAEACFMVWNPTEYPAPVHFEVRQLFDPHEENRIIWASWVKHPDPQFLNPGDRAQACVIIDPERADVPRGAKAEFAVTCFIGAAMIGGVNLIIVKK